MVNCIFNQVVLYHQRLPGFIRATLNDYGLNDARIDELLLGWDQGRVTVPVFDIKGRVVSINRYDLAADGKFRELAEQEAW